MRERAVKRKRQKSRTSKGSHLYSRRTYTRLSFGMKRSKSGAHSSPYDTRAHFNGGPNLRLQLPLWPLCQPIMALLSSPKTVCHLSKAAAAAARRWNGSVARQDESSGNELAPQKNAPSRSLSSNYRSALIIARTSSGRKWRQLRPKQDQSAD